MKKTVHLLAIATLAATFNGFSNTADSEGIGTKTSPAARDVSKRNAYVIYDHNEQKVEILYADSYEDVLAHVYILPAGIYWIGEKSAGGSETKRRIIVYTTTS